MDVKAINQYVDENVALYNADTCEMIKAIKSDSIDLSVFSPPIQQPLYLFQQRPRPRKQQKR